MQTRKIDHATSDPNAPLSGSSGLAPDEPRAGQDVRALVTQILVSRSIAANFSDDDVLTEIGMTSMDMVDLLLGIESAFDLDVPQNEMTPDVFRSVATIEALLRRLRPPIVPA